MFVSTLMLRSLFDQADFSDITIKFEQYSEPCDSFVEREVKCHKVILSHASPFFKSMCDSANEYVGGQPEVLELPDDDDGHLKEAVLRHIYGFTYAKIQEVCDFHCSRIDWQMDVIVAARKYMLPKLEQEALTALYNNIQELEHNCATPQGSHELFCAVISLKWYRPHNVEFERMARDLTVKHLAHLFKARRFRESLEQKDNKDLLYLIIQAVERGYPSQA